MPVRSFAFPFLSGTVARIGMPKFGAVLLVAACGGDGPAGPPQPAPVAAVTVTGPATLEEGQTAQFTATARDASGTGLTGRSFVWSTSNDAVASVSGNGAVATVTAKAPGPVTISATSESRKGDAPLTVTQIPVASLVVTPDTATLTVGGTRQLAAVARDASGNALTGRQITWTSSDTTKAKVSGTGTVTAVGAGTATITASAEGKNAPATITVVAPVISLSETSVSLTAPVGQAASDTVTVTNAGGGTLNGLSGIVTYGSGQPTGWLTASLNSTTAPATLTLQASAASLQPGTYNAAVTIRSSLSGVAEKTVNVTFKVEALPKIVVNAGSQTPCCVQLDATKPAGVDTTTAVITNEGGGTLTGLSATVNGDAGWLSLSLNTTTAPAILTLIASSANLPAGRHVADVTISSSIPGVAGRALTVVFNVYAEPCLGCE